LEVSDVDMEWCRGAAGAEAWRYGSEEDRELE
jgi:hypothetical protein